MRFTASFLCWALVISMSISLHSLSFCQQLTLNGKPILRGMWNGSEIEYVGGEIMVMFQDSDVPGDEIAASIGGQMVRGVEPDGFAKIEVDQNEDIIALCIKLYNSDPRVLSAEPNAVTYAPGKDIDHFKSEGNIGTEFFMDSRAWTPNDPYFVDSTQWALRNVGQDPPLGVLDADINIDWVWDYTTGSNDVVIAILGSGIDMDTANMTLRHEELDDPLRIILGVNFTGDGLGLADGHGSGTFKAGIAAAETNNGLGIAGIAKDCKILVVKVFSYSGLGHMEWIRDGINYSVAYQAAHPDKRVIMYCYSSNYSEFSYIHSALQNAEMADIPFVTVTSDADSSMCVYLCRESEIFYNIICVGAVDPWDQRADYSNYCSQINVVAPGGGFSTNQRPISCYPPNSYIHWGSTGMAAAHVVGICALIVSENPSISSVELRALIEQTADDEIGTIADDPQGFDNKYGHGRVNAWSAMIHSPAHPVSYLEQNQRFSAYATSNFWKFYYQPIPPGGNWEIVATRPHDGVDVNIRWVDSNGMTVLAQSTYTGNNVDFVLANGRDSTQLNQTAYIYRASGSGKFTAEYEYSEEFHVGSFWKTNHKWESSHVVDIFEVYLQNNHRYFFQVDFSSGQMDAGIALFGPGGSSASYLDRSSAIFDVNSLGMGLNESRAQTITTGDGWYAFVVYSTNGRHGDMDIIVQEYVYSNTPITLSEQDDIQVGDGYYYEELSNGSYMGVTGIRPYPGNNYNLYFYDNRSYGGGYLVGSYYSGSVVDFVLFDRATFPAGTYYPRVTDPVLNPGNTGYVFMTEDTNEWLSAGTNGPYNFDSASVANAWDLQLVNGTEYLIKADVISGALDIGIGLYVQDADFKARSDYLRIAYGNGPGMDESIIWECNSTAVYTLVAWTRNGEVGTYNLYIGEPPSVPMSVDDLVIERLDSTGVYLIWSQVTQDTSGFPLTVDYYRIHRSSEAEFVPSASDSIGYSAASDTTYQDLGVVWNYSKFYYKVIAVDTDGVLDFIGNDRGTFRSVDRR